MVATLRSKSLNENVFGWQEFNCASFIFCLVLHRWNAKKQFPCRKYYGQYPL